MSYINENEFDTWVQSLYQDASMYFDIILPGNKKLRMCKRFPASELVKIQQGKSEFEKNILLISAMCKLPKLSPEQIMKLPAEIITQILQEIKKHSDIFSIDKKK